jgi:hypothetical protein
MTKGMRLLILVFILICIVVAMMQCAEKTMHKKKPHIEDGSAPLPPFHYAIYPSRPGRWAASPA